MGSDTLNMITTIGAFLFGSRRSAVRGQRLLRSRKSGALAGDNPWDAARWNGRSRRRRRPTTSPSFRRSRHAIRCGKTGSNETDQRSNLEEGFILDHGKEALATSALDAEPNDPAHARRYADPVHARTGHAGAVQRSPHPQRSDSLHRRDRLCTGPGRLVLAAGEFCLERRPEHG